MIGLSEYWAELSTLGKIAYVGGAFVLGWTVGPALRLWRQGDRGPIVAWGTVFWLYALWIMGIL